MSYTRGQLIEWVQSTIEQYRDSCASDKNSFQYRADLDSKVRALLPVLYRLQDLETRCRCSHDTNPAPAPDPIRRDIATYLGDLGLRIERCKGSEEESSGAKYYELATRHSERAAVYRLVSSELQDILGKDAHVGD